MTVSQPTLVSRTALSGVRVAISVSESADLARLGLDGRHLDLAVSEIARAVLIAGGIVVYGGRLQPTGYTQKLIAEVARFAADRHALTLCVAFPEHAGMDEEDLRDLDASLGVWGALHALNADGTEVRWQSVDRAAAPLTSDENANAYSGLRRYMAENTDARIIVGGKLRGFKGSMPGVIEEALTSVQARRPLFVAGGFGGAAAAVGRRVAADAFGWLPEGLPEGGDDLSVLGALEVLESAHEGSGHALVNGGLDEEERRLLFASHRPGEIASLAVLGLARLRESAAP